jgi:endoglucanase
MQSRCPFLLLFVAALATSSCIAGPSPGGAAAPTATNLKSCGPSGLIDDGEDGNNQVADANRALGGYWYTFSDKAGSSITPKAGAEGGKFTMSPGGANKSQYGANMKGKVAVGDIVYAGMGLNFVDPKGPYDASKFKGVSFWAKKGPGSTGKVRLKVPDTNTDPEGKVCTACFNDFGKELSLSDEWTKYTVSYDEMRQLSGWGAPRPASVLAQKLYGLQWQVNQPGAAFDIWIDDVEFLCE